LFGDLISISIIITFVCCLSPRELSPSHSHHGISLHKEEKYVQPDGSEVVIPNKRLKLTDTAIPTIFPHQPKYMSTAAAPVRQSLKIRDVQKKVFADNVAQKKIERDRISTIGDIKSKLGSKIRNLQFVVTYVRDSIFFLNIKYSNGYPEPTSSLHVRSDLSVI
jgi:hypothetical protein